MKLLHSVNIQERAISSDGVESYDLGVNPLSVLLLCLRPLNETSTLTNYARYLSIVGALNRVSVFDRGDAILNMTGRDIAALNYFRHGCLPPEANADDADNERRMVVLPLFFGRFPYDSESCFPARRRGELILELDWDVADTGYDGMRFSAESIELPEAKPKEFERKVQTATTFASTGLTEVDLPLGHLCRGVLLFGTTAFDGAAPAPSFGRVSVVVDNQAHSIMSSDVEVQAAVYSLLGRVPPRHDAHTHRVNAGSASTTEETTGSIEVGRGGWENYAWVDFDPTRNDEFSVDASSASQFVLRADVETADAVRVVAVERVKVT